MKFSRMFFIFRGIKVDIKPKKRELLSFFGILAIAALLSGCTTTAESQLKESACLECAKKTPFYRNGEWLHD